MFYITYGFQCLWWFQLSQLPMNTTSCPNCPWTSPTVPIAHEHHQLSQLPMNIKTLPHIKLKHNFMFFYWTFTRTFNVHRAESESKSVGPTLCNSLGEQLLLTIHSQSQFWLGQLPSLKTLVCSMMQVLHREKNSEDCGMQVGFGLGLIQGHSVCDLWWTKCTGTRFCFQVIQVSPASTILPMLHTHSFSHPLLVLHNLSNWQGC